MAKKQQVEHIVYQGDDIAGLYTIDGFEVRRVFGNKRFWEGMDEIMRLYKELHPHEIDVVSVDNAIQKDKNMNQYGSTQEGVHRLALQIPIGLLNIMKDYEPTIIKDNKLRHAVMKRYPFLRGCHTV